MNESAKDSMETKHSLHLALDLLITVRHSMCGSRHGKELQKGIMMQEDRQDEQDATRHFMKTRSLWCPIWDVKCSHSQTCAYCHRGVKYLKFGWYTLLMPTQIEWVTSGAGVQIIFDKVRHSLNFATSLM